jgi:glycosyltransferase involved in cell wall biosynthesis
MRRALESAFSQDFHDLEVVISDNTSDDGTPEILREYADRDPRVRYSVNRENVGILENVNTVFRMARGEYVRLLGSDDWLEPDFVSRCVETLDGRPEATGVTTGFYGHFDSGETIENPAPGHVPDSPGAAERLSRMLWFYRHDPLLYDPMHALFRRDALMRSGLIRPMANGDQILTAELALMGSILHRPEPLFHRRKAFPSSREALLRRLHPTRWPELDIASLRAGSVLLSIVWQTRLEPSERMRCLSLVAGFTAYRAKQFAKHKTRALRQRRGATRRDLGERLNGASGR